MRSATRSRTIMRMTSTTLPSLPASFPHSHHSQKEIRNDINFEIRAMTRMSLASTCSFERTWRLELFFCESSLTDPLVDEFTLMKERIKRHLSTLGTHRRLCYVAENQERVLNAVA